MVRLFLPGEGFEFTGKAIVFKCRIVANPNQVIRKFKEGSGIYYRDSTYMENAFGSIYFDSL